MCAPRRGAVGVAAAGFVDAPGARVRFAPHLSWRDEPLRDRLGDRFGLPVLVANDANAALWGEARFGAARGADHVLMVTLGTGIGGALLVGGRAAHRAQRHGRRVRPHAGRAGRPSVRVRAPGLLGAVLLGQGAGPVRPRGRVGRPGQALMEAASHGEPVAQGAFVEVGRWLGIGLADLVAAFDPDLVLVGGGVSAAGELLLEPARRTFAEAWWAAATARSRGSWPPDWVHWPGSSVPPTWPPARRSRGSRHAVATLRVMTYNILLGGHRGAPLHDLVRTVAPDVLLVNESPSARCCGAGTPSGWPGCGACDTSRAAALRART